MPPLSMIPPVKLPPVELSTIPPVPMPPVGLPPVPPINPLVPMPPVPRPPALPPWPASLRFSRPVSNLPVQAAMPRPSTNEMTTDFLRVFILELMS
jgi:hypothetical protein